MGRSAFVVVLAPAAAFVLSASASAGSGQCLLAPVPGPSITPFVAPGCPYCAGHRTVDFFVVGGEPVRLPISGSVHFRGAVAGRQYVTVRPTVDPSLLVTVGGVIGDGRELRLGEAVRRGEVIGRAVGGGPVRLSLRKPDSTGRWTYVDPAPYVARWRVGARLVPVDGSPARPVRPVLGCRRALGGDPDRSR